MATEAAGDLDRDMSVSTHALDGPLDPETKEALHIVFETFAAFGVPRTALDEGPLGMDSSQFRRLMVDSKLLHAELASSDVDLAFLKAGKARGVRKLRFGAFLAALQTLAPKSRSHMSYVDLATRLSSMLGPDMTGLTTPDAVRLHDDKSTYTGLAARIAYSASYGVGVDA
ncbi:hypothetical protein H632_c3195p0 [Helicosporidium sp. ATCC 50920]|nr:hypothetical protein H632_c3195p0 [Helicosporidium sp. ATCC 50920]|eukprot:KDD72555.1 hypothetical protein H632_c3195p0 [Helicosporidium sp. ATCC 50920]